MRRKTLDLLLNWVGTLLTAVLLVAGIGMLVGYNFTNSQVRSQLVGQKVFFPKSGERDYQDLVKVNMTNLAGQQVLTGKQAQIFANDIIGVDTAAIGAGKTYAELSAAALADPSNAALANQVELVFRGDTLQGLLLNAYAFGFIGQLALYGAIGSFIAALLMLILTLLGIRHYRQADPAEVI
ncbi:MAG: hypothetical protein HKL86_04855 [Acidimicrobiaceae bacterium]|nr:hypothetical protein [Acidimicrobiaceae bacterium]